MNDSSLFDFYCFRTSSVIENLDNHNYWHAYALKCESGKWYVGISSLVKNRIEQHEKQEGNGAGWTKIYKPIRLEEVRNIDNKDDRYKVEKELTAKYAFLYGIKNVRGWQFSNLKLSPIKIKAYERLCYQYKKDLEYQRKKNNSM